MSEFQNRVVVKQDALLKNKNEHQPNTLNFKQVESPELPKPIETYSFKQHYKKILDSWIIAIPRISESCIYLVSNIVVGLYSITTFPFSRKSFSELHYDNLAKSTDNIRWLFNNHIPGKSILGNDNEFAKLSDQELKQRLNPLFWVGEGIFSPIIEPLEKRIELARIQGTKSAYNFINQENLNDAQFIEIEQKSLSLRLIKVSFYLLRAATELIILKKATPNGKILNSAGVSFGMSGLNALGDKWIENKNGLELETLENTLSGANSSLGFMIGARKLGGVLGRIGEKKRNFVQQERHLRRISSLLETGDVLDSSGDLKESYFAAEGDLLFPTAENKKTFLVRMGHFAKITASGLDVAELNTSGNALRDVSPKKSNVTANYLSDEEAVTTKWNELNPSGSKKHVASFIDTKTNQIYCVKPDKSEIRETRIARAILINHEYWHAQGCNELESWSRTYDFAVKNNFSLIIEGDLVLPITNKEANLVLNKKEFLNQIKKIYKDLPESSNFHAAHSTINPTFHRSLLLEDIKIILKHLELRQRLAWTAFEFTPENFVLRYRNKILEILSQQAQRRSHGLFPPFFSANTIAKTFGEATAKSLRLKLLKSQDASSFNPKELLKNPFSPFWLSDDIRLAMASGTTPIIKEAGFYDKVFELLYVHAFKGGQNAKPISLSNILQHANWRELTSSTQELEVFLCLLCELGHGDNAIAMLRGNEKKVTSDCLALYRLWNTSKAPQVGLLPQIRTNFSKISNILATYACHSKSTSKNALIDNYLVKFFLNNISLEAEFLRSDKTDVKKPEHRTYWRNIIRALVNSDIFTFSTEVTDIYQDIINLDEGNFEFSNFIFKEFVNELCNSHIPENKTLAADFFKEQWQDKFPTILDFTNINASEIEKSNFLQTAKILLENNLNIPMNARVCLAAKYDVDYLESAVKNDTFEHRKSIYVITSALIKLKGEVEAQTPGWFEARRIKLEKLAYGFFQFSLNLSAKELDSERKQIISLFEQWFYGVKASTTRDNSTFTLSNSQIRSTIGGEGMHEQKVLRLIALYLLIKSNFYSQPKQHFLNIGELSSNLLEIINKQLSTCGPNYQAKVLQEMLGIILFETNSNNSTNEFSRIVEDFTAQKTNSQTKDINNIPPNLISLNPQVSSLFYIASMLDFPRTNLLIQFLRRINYSLLSAEQKQKLYVLAKTFFEQNEVELDGIDDPILHNLKLLGIERIKLKRKVLNQIIKIISVHNNGSEYGTLEACQKLNSLNWGELFFRSNDTIILSVDPFLLNDWCEFIKMLFRLNLKEEAWSLISEHSAQSSNPPFMKTFNPGHIKAVNSQLLEEKPLDFLELIQLAAKQKIKIERFAELFEKKSSNWFYQINEEAIAREVNHDNKLYWKKLGTLWFYAQRNLLKGKDVREIIAALIIQRQNLIDTLNQYKINSKEVEQEIDVDMTAALFTAGTIDAVIEISKEEEFANYKQWRVWENFLYDGPYQDVINTIRQYSNSSLRLTSHELACLIEVVAPLLENKCAINSELDTILNSRSATTLRYKEAVINSNPDKATISSLGEAGLFTSRIISQDNLKANQLFRKIVTFILNGLEQKLKELNPFATSQSDREKLESRIQQLSDLIKNSFEILESEPYGIINRDKGLIFWLNLFDYLAVKEDLEQSILLEVLANYLVTDENKKTLEFLEEAARTGGQITQHLVFIIFPFLFDSIISEENQHVIADLIDNNFFEP